MNKPEAKPRSADCSQTAEYKFTTVNKHSRFLFFNLTGILSWSFQMNGVLPIPKPFLFNPLKHHLGYINSYIKQYNEDLSNLRKDLQLIGSSQMDIYCGTMLVGDIVENISNFLTNSLINNKIQYIEVILKVNKFRVIDLSDGSKWVLLPGIDPDRFIHFHPARYSPNTFRITANALKSLIAAGIMFGQSMGLKEINSARALLGLGPIRKLNPNQGIGKYLQYF